MRNLKRALSLGLTAAMISGLMVMGSSAASYADVTSEDNVEAIDVLQAVGIMVGDENGDFNPDQNVTRNEMAVVMANLMEYNVASYKDTSPFTDVPSWAEPYVAACWTNGITAGYSDTIYGGSDTVTTAQAALMLMKALGYFQYASDFGSDWQLATTRQGNAIDLFTGVDSGVTQAMTRNDVAQLVLNTLRSGTVEASTDGSWTIGDVTINNNVTYSYITSNADYADAIDDVRSTSNTTDANRYVVELGEQLYMGDLQLNDNARDVFSRPARYWEYNGSEIGTYAKTELLKQTYTTQVTGRDLYDLLTSTVVDTYDFTIAIDGIEDPDIDPVLFDETSINRNNRDGVGTGADATGNGVLTEVYVNTTDREVTIAIINTYLAQANSDYNENRDELSLTVYNLDQDNDDNLIKDNDQDTTLRVEGEDFAMAADAVEDDFFLVTVADGEIQTMAAPEIQSNAEITGFQTRNENNEGNLTADGTRYEYAFTARYDVDTLNNYTIIGSTNLKDTTYNIIMDAYGYVIGVEEVDGGDNYVFITGVDSNYSNLSARTLDANAIFLDGTMDTITINLVDSKMPSLNHNVSDSVLNTWYTYSVNSSGVYTVEEVSYVIDDDHDAAQSATATWDTDIDSEHIRLPGSGAANGYANVYGNDETVYLTASVAEISVAANTTALVIDDVNSVVTGVENVDIEPWYYNRATAPATHDMILDADDDVTPDSFLDSGYVSSGVYPLFDDDGYIIAAVVVGDDGGSATDFVYVHSSRVSQESYDSSAEEWTWTRDVIINGEEVTIREVNDTEMSYIEDMDRWTWYRVRYNSAGDVIDAEAMPNGEFGYDAGYTGGAWGNTSTDTVYYDTIQQVTDDIEAGTHDTIIYFAGDGADTENYNRNGNGQAAEVTSDDFVGVPNKPFISGRSLYVSRDYDGVRISEDVNVVFTQTNDNRTTTEFFSGVNELEDVLDELNTENGRYDFNIGMVIENSMATTVIIRDWTYDGDAGIAPGGQQGNVQTLYSEDYADYGLNLDGSTADVSFTVNEYGMMTATLNYTAPDWVPVGAEVDLTFPVQFYGVRVTDATFSGVVGANHTATMYWTSAPFAFYAYTDTDNLNFGRATVETFSDVNVYWVDQSDNNLSGVMTGLTESLTTDDAHPERLTATYANSSAGNAQISSVNMRNGWTDVDVAYSALKDGWESNTDKSATGEGPVVIIWNISGVDNRYTASDTAIDLGDLDNTDPADAAAQLTFQTTSPDTGLAPGAKVNYTMTLDKNAFHGDVLAYSVTVEKLGIRNAILYRNNWTVATGVATVGTSNVAITADDIQIEAVEALAIESIEWDATTVTITLNRTADVDNGTIELGRDSSNGGMTDADVDDKTVITYTVKTGDTLSVTDKLDVIQGDSSRDISDDYGYIIANGTITLNADGSGTYTAD